MAEFLHLRFSSIQTQFHGQLSAFLCRFAASVPAPDWLGGRCGRGSDVLVQIQGSQWAWSFSCDESNEQHLCVKDHSICNSASVSGLICGVFQHTLSGGHVWSEKTVQAAEKFPKSLPDQYWLNAEVCPVPSCLGAAPASIPWCHWRWEVLTINPCKDEGPSRAVSQTQHGCCRWKNYCCVMFQIL